VTITEALAHTCHKLEYLELSFCSFASEPLICNDIQYVPTQSLKFLDLDGCENISKKVIYDIFCMVKSCLYDLDNVQLYQLDIGHPIGQSILRLHDEDVSTIATHSTKENIRLVNKKKPKSKREKMKSTRNLL
jgi:hypothetical protein